MSFPRDYDCVRSSSCYRAIEATAPKAEKPKKKEEEAKVREEGEAEARAAQQWLIRNSKGKCPHNAHCCLKP